MRRRLVLLSLATTVLVVVAFVIPLCLLVRRQAVETAQVGAERNTQSVAGLVALAVAVSDDPADVAGAIGVLPEGTIVVLGDSTIGTPRTGQGTLVVEAERTRGTVVAYVSGGWEMALPVVGGTSVAVVDSFVSDADMTAGVAGAWILLGSLAVILIGVAVLVADRLGRRLTAPIEDLAHSARRLAEGDLESRVEPADPEEIRETGEAFNYLAGRLDQLLAEERESAADLSHRLRTPLTSLRLQAESLTDPAEREAMLVQVDRLEHSMNQLIELSRSRGSREPGRSILDEVVVERSAFWSVLAEEQGRVMTTALEAGRATVGLAPDETGVLIDTLVGNVFAHTDPPTPFDIRTGVDDGGHPCLEVLDRGPGFTNRSVLERGVSGGGSTGLGLDIVRKSAEATGGSLDVDDRPGGGAVVRVRFGWSRVGGEPHTPG